jgi:hypothetical protein
MTKYPWFGRVLFAGQYYDATELPYSYLPVLLLFQFTEPVWILFIIGLGCASHLTLRFFRPSGKSLPADSPAREGATQLLALTTLWFVLPLLGFIVTRAKLYDNFRQLFFILPPVFLVAGLGMESLLESASHLTLRFFRLSEKSSPVDSPPRQGATQLLALLLILPGLIAGIRLHPYQYVYYNLLAGNPNGRFELDYWAISYREAMEYVNSVAPANSNIMVVGPGQAADLYARDDVTVLSDDAPTTERFAYAVITTRYDFDKTLYPGAKVIYVIERDGLVLTVIKRME